MTRRHIRMVAAVGLIVVGGGSLPPTGAQAVGAPAHRNAGRAVKLAIRQLPPGRRTVARLANYYYGSSAMSFVIVAANSWLDGYPVTRSLAEYTGSSQHSSVVIPTVRGVRPVGP
jgi:hypothetical protein